jgi:uncharacterized protein YndB with AHSA1/START domain
MFEVIVIIAVMLAIAIAAVLILAATKPGTLRVQRSVSIKAPPEKVFPLINNLKTMNEWNPFAKQDPTIRIKYSGPASGKGAANDWDSDGRAGQGRLEITESAPPSQITMRLDIAKPMEVHNTMAFALQRQADGTRVTWAMSGKPGPLKPQETAPVRVTLAPWIIAPVASVTIPRTAWVLD